MHGELPEFKRCCCCLPLRRGLVGWGYFRLAFDVLAVIIFVIISIVRMSSYSYALYYDDMIICIAVVICYFIDSVFAMFLIVGGHKKSHKLLRISYIYCIVWVAVMLILGGLIVYTDISRIRRRGNISLSSIENITLDLAMMFATIFMQVYLILLTRSEEIKLRKEKLGMRFVNNAANAESICVNDDI